MIITWVRILLRAMSENDQIQMYLSVILTPKVFPKHDGISRFEGGNRQHVCSTLYRS